MYSALALLSQNRLTSVSHSLIQKKHNYAIPVEQKAKIKIGVILSTVSQLLLLKKPLFNMNDFEFPRPEDLQVISQKKLVDVLTKLKKYYLKKIPENRPVDCRNQYQI